MLAIRYSQNITKEIMKSTLVENKFEDSQPVEPNAWRAQVVANRYAEILRQQDIKTRFSENEWDLLRDSLRGVFMQPAETIVELWQGIEDSIELDGLNEKWDVKGDVLLSKLKLISFTSAVAIVEEVEQFWRATGIRNNPEIQATLF